MAKELRVLVADEEIGTVTQRDNGRLTFAYDEEWRTRIDSFPLSLSMPLTQREHSGKVVANYLWGLLTDDPVARRELANIHNVSHRSVFALIAAGGEDLPGAVQIVPREDAKKVTQRKGVSPISDERLAGFLANLVKHPGATQIEEDAASFSLAGVQPKKAICRVSGRWYEPRGHGRTPTTHIIKPPLPHLDGQVENEHFCLRLARKIGLRTTSSSVELIGGIPNVVVERYDRVRIHNGRVIPLSSPQKASKVFRIHQEDFCQALNTHPELKYQRDGGPGIKDAMQLLEASGDAKTDRDRFMLACIFNFIILGIDAHAKNFSVLLEPGGRFRLAPLYDIISALPYDPEMYNSLAMNIGGVRRWGRVGVRSWQKLGKSCGYNIALISNEMNRLLAELPSAADKVLRDVKKDGLDTRVLSQLVANLKIRCASLSDEYKDGF